MTESACPIRKAAKQSANTEWLKLAPKYCQYSLAVLSSSEGMPNRTYDAWASFNQGFQVGKLGVQRVGAFTYFGQRPTFFNTSLGTPVLGEGLGNKSLYRAGLTSLVYVKKLDFSTVFTHGWDKAFLGTGTAANAPLPLGARAPTAFCRNCNASILS
jgi:hypothetical protein